MNNSPIDRFSLYHAQHLVPARHCSVPFRRFPRYVKYGEFNDEKGDKSLAEKFVPLSLALPRPRRDYNDRGTIGTRGEPRDLWNSTERSFCWLERVSGQELLLVSCLRVYNYIRRSGKW